MASAPAQPRSGTRVATIVHAVYPRNKEYNMSYKKFSRNHGKTHRVRKYKWSNPDHNYRGEMGKHPVGCSRFIGINITVCRPSEYGYRSINPNHQQLRRARHLLNAEVRLLFR